MQSVVASDSRLLNRRPARLVIAALVLGLTGLAFVVAAAILIYGTQVNTPPVALFFAAVAAVLVVIAVLHFVAARGIWSHHPLAGVLGIVISLLATALSGSIWFDQFTHSEDAWRVATPYLVTALSYAACLVSLLTSGLAFEER